MSTTESPATRPHRRLVIDTRIVIELPDERPVIDYVRAAHNFLSDHAGNAVSAWPAGREVLIKVAQTAYEEKPRFEGHGAAIAGEGEEAVLHRLVPVAVSPDGTHHLRYETLQGSLL